MIAGSSSLDTVPVTGSLLFNACESGLLFSDCFFGRVSGDFVMATDSDGGRSGITFGVTLEVPWNALEAYVRLHSDGVVDLGTVPDVLGLSGRRPESAVVMVLQGRDTRSVHPLIPDPRVWKEDFTTLPSWIWRTRQSRLCQTTSPCFGSSGQ